MTSANPTAPALVGPAFWRRNPLLASSMRAIVMALADGRFTAIGPDGAPVWDSPASGISGSLGKMGTLKITVNGQKFAVVGRGSIGGMEHGHTEIQRQYLADFLQRHPNSQAASMHAWRDALVTSGASVS